MKITTRPLAAYTILIAVVTSIGIASVKNTLAAEPIVIGTASPGGPYLAYGQGLARILSRELGQEVTAQATQGPAQNIALLEKQEIQLAFITMGVGMQAWNGTEWTKGTRYRSMRVIFPMYDTAFQFVAAKHLRINWLDDLAGLRIGVGPRAGTGGTYVPEIFKALDINVSVRYGTVESMGSQLISGELDGVVFGTGYPVPVLVELSAAHPVDFIQPSGQQVATIRKRIPEISPSVVPIGTYPSLLRDYHTVGLYNFAIVHKELADDVVYKIVKAVFENHEELVRAQSSASETIPANIKRNTFLPVHPGAARYYREIGIPVPTENTP